MERRLHQPALALPEFTVAREQAVARDRANLGGAARGLIVVARVGLQHVFDVVWMIQQMHNERADGKPNDVAVLSRAIQQ